MIKVSVIVPVYNCAEYLHQCLDSLVDQTMKPEELEIICINDGSTDNSLQILNEYSAKYKNIAVYNQEDLGQGYTVNRGIKLAQGEYVAECDSDDYVKPNMYEELYKTAVHFGSDAVKCNFIEVEGARCWMVREQISENFCNEPFNFRDLHQEHQNILIGRIPSLFAGIYKRSFILDNNLLYRVGPNYEDCSLSKKIAMTAHNFVFSDKALYFYRKNRPGSGTATIKNIYDICEQFDECIRFSRENNLNAEQCINSVRFYDYMWMMDRITDESQKAEFAKRMSNDFRANLVSAFYFNSVSDWMLYNQIAYGIKDGT